jgi:hypothetical protein
MVSVMVLGVTVLMASAVFPASALLRNRSGGFSTAAAIAQRKLEQVRKLDATRLNYNGLRAAGIIDTMSTPPSGSTGEYPFTLTDNLTQDLQAGQGRIRLSGIGTDLVTAEVRLNWVGLRGRAEQIQATTAVADKRVWREP